MPARRRFGSVRRLPSGRWQARYWDAAGDRAGAPVTFATKGDAQRGLSAAETDMNRGEWHDPRLGDVPFGEWAERWLATKAPKLQASTVDLYRYLLRRHIVPHFGALAVGRITAVEIQAWLARLRPALVPTTQERCRPAHHRHPVVRRPLARRAHSTSTPAPVSTGSSSRAPTASPCGGATSDRRVWEPAMAEVGMGSFRVHDLRHTAATLAAPAARA